MKTQFITLMLLPALNLLAANPPAPKLPPDHHSTTTVPDPFNANQFNRPLTNRLGTNDRGFTSQFATGKSGTLPPRDRIFPPTTFPPDRFPPDKFPPDRISPGHLKKRPAPPKNVTIIPSTPGATPLVVKVKNRGR